MLERRGGLDRSSDRWIGPRGRRRCVPARASGPRCAAAGSRRSRPAPSAARTRSLCRTAPRATARSRFDPERGERADHPTLHAPKATRERQQVAEHADEVGHPDHRERRRRAEGVEHRPQHAACQSPTTPARQAGRARARGTSSIAVRTPLAASAGTVAAARHPAGESTGARSPASQAPLDVLGQQRHRTDGAEQDRGDDRGHDRHRERAASREQARGQADAVDQQRACIDHIQQHHERDHAAGHQTGLHPRAPQRPCGHRDAAGAGGREQAGRREAGHRDLIALPPADRAGRGGGRSDRARRTGPRVTKTALNSTM